MAINFPSSPANNQVYIDPVSGGNYTYNNVFQVWNKNINAFQSTNAISTYLIGDGISNTFTITSFFNNQNNSIVTVDGLVQIPGIHYNIVGTTLNFSSPPTVYSAIEVRNLEQGPFGTVGYVGSRGSTGFAGSTGFTGSAGTSVSSGRSIAMSIIFGG